MFGTAYAALAREFVRKIDLSDPDLKWRHHGLGMLQAELTDEIRIHVWHPKLVRIPQDNFRNVHDHRFHITSFVAAGSIVDVAYDVIPATSLSRTSKHALTEVHEIVNAKEQLQAEPGKLTTLIGAVFTCPVTTSIYRAGDVYNIPRRTFHTTRVDSVAVTLVHRGNFDKAQARILGPSDVVGSAIVRDDPEAAFLRERVLIEAIDALSDVEGPLVI